MSLDLEGFSKLGHRARVLVFVRYLFRTQRINDQQRGVLKDLALEGSDFLEAATELLCMDNNEDECTDSFLNAAVVTLTPRAARSRNRTSAWVEEEEEGGTGAASVGRPAPEPVSAAGDGSNGGSDGDAAGSQADSDSDADADDDDDDDDNDGDREDGGSSTSSDLEHESKVAAIDESTAHMAQDLVEFARLAGLDALDVDTVVSILKAKPHEEAGFTREQLCAAMQVFAPKTGDASASDFKQRVLALFDSLDADGNDIVDFAELAAGLSLLCGGSSDDKITAVFKLFDLDGDGVITLTEMTTYLTSVFRVIFDRTPELGASLGVSADTMAEVTAMDAFETADLDNNGEISLAEFREWYSQKSSDGFKDLVAAQDAQAEAEGAGGAAGGDSGNAPAPASAAARNLITEERLLSLTNVRELKAKELLLLFRRVGEAGAGGEVRLTFDTFMDAFRLLLTPTASVQLMTYLAFAEALFNSFDRRDANAVDAREVAAGLSIVCDAGSKTVSERLWQAFLLFDISGDGYLQRDELEALVSATHRMRLAIGAPPGCLLTKVQDQEPDAFAKTVVQQVFESARIDDDTTLVAFDDFVTWCTRDAHETGSAESWAFFVDIMGGEPHDEYHALCSGSA